MKHTSSGTFKRLRQALSIRIRQPWRSLWRSGKRNRSSTKYHKDSTPPAPLPDSPRRPSAEVININDRRGTPSKGAEQPDRPLVEHPRAEPTHKLVDEPRPKLEPHGIVVAATAAVLLAGAGLWWSGLQSSDPDTTVQSAEGEMKRYILQGDVVASLSSGATIWVDGRGKHEQARLVEGVAKFDVPVRDELFELATYLATARTAGPSRFTVSVGSGVEFKVHAGEVAIARVGAKKQEDVIKLKPGRTLRLMGATVASEGSDGRALATHVAWRTEASMPKNNVVGPASGLVQDGL